jgi:hypothetical protein
MVVHREHRACARDSSVVAVLDVHLTTESLVQLDPAEYLLGYLGVLASLRRVIEA